MSRWRFYKYNAGDIFRPHTDGSWPGSGIADGRLVHDIFGDRWSMLTWVLYLNDDFEGGGTRFMLPDGVFNQYTVHQVPATRGSVLCFYHGEHPLSPLHEGEMVTVGTKYIVRSDVLYKLWGRTWDWLQQSTGSCLMKQQKMQKDVGPVPVPA